MKRKDYDYVIIGAGLAGASAVVGIREKDSKGSVLLLGKENHLPYDRPPLTKQLWSGKKHIEEIFLYDEAFYSARHVEIKTGTSAENIDSSARVVTDSEGNTHGYRKLLLATGGAPRRLSIPGGELSGVCYYRYIDDYRRIQAETSSANKTAVVVGGGFIGSEITAALCTNNVDVTMVFPDEYLVSRVFPKSLGMFLTEKYRERGVRILSEDAPISIEKQKDKFIIPTKNGLTLNSDVVIVGIGITPTVALARQAGLLIENGISVNQYLQSSNPEIFAAGDNTSFPYLALDQKMRVEHWDNALNQGKCAGRNMVRADEPYSYMPYFFSDLFEFGYEAVGEVDARLDTSAEWQKENDTGTIYYRKDGNIRGVMMCNVWDKVDMARKLISKKSAVTSELLSQTT